MKQFYQKNIDSIYKKKLGGLLLNLYKNGSISKENNPFVYTALAMI